MRYAYGSNNPVKYTDPSGHISCYGDNYDDGPGCLKIKDSALSIEVHNAEWRQKHPITPSDVAWGLAMIGTAGAAEYALLGGAAADAVEAGIWGVASACIQSSVCRLITGMAGGATAVPHVWTPYGDAYQEYTPEALEAREAAMNGAPLYKLGSLGNSYASGSQFWSLKNPLETPGYVESLGIPAENVAADHFLIIGQALSNANLITRAAPSVGTNPGGAIEVVTDFYSVVLSAFTMP